MYVYTEYIVLINTFIHVNTATRIHHINNIYHIVYIIATS